MVKLWRMGGFFFAYIGVSLSVYAESSQQFFSGMSVSRQQNDQSSLTQTRYDTGFSIVQQQLNATGGYTIETSARLNKGLNGQGDIKQGLLSLSHLQALNADWLWRLKAEIEHLDNQIIPSLSLDSLSLETTIGYLQQDYRGIDLGIKVNRENHSKDKDDRFNRTLVQLNGRYYFPHDQDAAYWSFGGDISRYNSNKEAHHSTQLLLSLDYRQWRWYHFQGRVVLNWFKEETDPFQQVVATRNRQQAMPIPMNGVGQGGMNPLLGMINDTYRVNQHNESQFVSLQLSQSLNKTLTWQMQLAVGRYRSVDERFNLRSLSSESSSVQDDFYQVSSQLHWFF